MSKNEIVKATLKKGVSKNNPNKCYYIFDLQVYDDLEGDYVSFKDIFCSEFEGRALRRMGVQLTDLESKIVDDTNAE